MYWRSLGLVGSPGVHVFLPGLTRFWVSICCSGLAVGLLLVAVIHFPRVWLKVDPFGVDLDFGGGVRLPLWMWLALTLVQR